MEKLKIRQIRQENKLKKQESRRIKSLHPKKIRSEKKILKNKISLEENKNKKNILKEEYKNKFILGKQKNSKGNIIDIRKMNKYFCNGITCEHILKDINLQIKKGKVAVILGASGSGKSTLLNVMSGLTEATYGDVIVNNNNLFYLNESKRTKFRKDNLSFVFQSYNLIPTLTVIENIKVGENLRGKNAQEIPMEDILKTLGLEYQAKKYPFQLSGGQNQRVSIGRAMAKNPNILFADEPTGALDEQKGREALQMLLDINKKFKTTLVMVTHNPNFFVIADIVIYVKDGRIDNIINNNVTKEAKDINWS